MPATPTPAPPRKGEGSAQPFLRYTRSDLYSPTRSTGRSFSQIAMTFFALIGPSQAKAKLVVKNRMWPPGRV